MSTRATYTIQSKDWNGSKTEKHFYIHYDGYLEGAAEYFKNMFLCKNKRGGLVCMFIRGNDLAEFTSHPDHHGDTEYHYNINGNELTAYEIKRDWKTEKFEKVIVYNGLITEFINKYAESEKEDKSGFCIFKNQVTTKKELGKQLQELLKTVKQQIFDKHTGNASSNFIDVMQINNYLCCPITDDMLKIAAFFVEQYGHNKTPIQWINEICLRDFSKV